MFDRFRVSADDLLGWGGESQVYALDQTRVLRVCWPGANAEYLERRRALYDWLARYDLGFALPTVLESGSLGDRLYTVERRMPGRVFSGLFPTLAGADRQRALASYLDAAERIGTVELPDRPFGEFITAGEPLQRDSWPAYLWDRLQQVYRLSRPDLERDVPEIDAILAHVRAEIGALEGFAEKRLVHGDYFPGNVYVDDALQVRGVGDFGYSTLVGDPRMDLAGAVAFLEVVSGNRPEDVAYLTRLVEERRGSGILRWLYIYRLYYSLCFSHSRLDDPSTYAWCVRTLTAWRRWVT